MKMKSCTHLLILAVMVILLPAVIFAAPVPDTGQTQSYTNTFGEDHDYTINPHSYTDLGNGIVRDNVTGLQWVKDGNLIRSRDPVFDADGPADGKVIWQLRINCVGGGTSGDKTDFLREGTLDRNPKRNIQSRVREDRIQRHRSARMRLEGGALQQGALEVHATAADRAAGLDDVNGRAV